MTSGPRGAALLGLLLAPALLGQDPPDPPAAPPAQAAQAGDSDGLAAARRALGMLPARDAPEPDAPMGTGTLRGRVVDNHGQPVASGWCLRADVWDDPSAPGTSSRMTSVTAEGQPDGDGSFRWDGVPAGRYSLSILAVEPSASTVEGRCVTWEHSAAKGTVDAGAEEVVELVFPRAIRLIIEVAPGTAYAPTLQPPLESVWLLGPLPDGLGADDVLDGGSLRKDAIGIQGVRVPRHPFQYRPHSPAYWLDDRYEVVDPPEGRYIAVLGAPGYTTARSAELTVGQTAALHTQGTCALTLSGVDDDTGAAVEGITVNSFRLSRHGPPGYWIGPEGGYSPGGLAVSETPTAEVTDLVPGEWSITVGAPGYVPAASAPVMLDPCAGPREVVVRLKRGAARSR